MVGDQRVKGVSDIRTALFVVVDHMSNQAGGSKSRPSRMYVRSHRTFAIAYAMESRRDTQPPERCVVSPMLPPDHDPMTRTLTALVHSLHPGGK